MNKLAAVLFVLLIAATLAQPPISDNEKKWVRRTVIPNLAMVYVLNMMDMFAWGKPHIHVAKEYIIAYFFIISIDVSKMN